MRARLFYHSPTGVTIFDNSLLLLLFLFFLLFLLYETLQILCCVSGRRKTAFFSPSVIYLSLVSKRGPLPLLPSLFPILVHELIVRMMTQFPSHPCEQVFVLFPLSASTYHRFLQNGPFSLRDTRYHMIFFFLLKEKGIGTWPYG